MDTFGNFGYEGEKMKYAIPIECQVTINICVIAPTAGDAAKCAESYWAKHYENLEEPCLVEGKYTKGSATVMPLGAVNLQSRGGAREYESFVYTIKEKQDGKRKEGDSPLA